MNGCKRFDISDIITAIVVLAFDGPIPNKIGPHILAILKLVV